MAASNVFIALPQPAGNGSGASVDTSGMGANKTIVVGSSGGVYEPVTVVEVSNDGGVNWAPIATFNGPNSQSVTVSCARMRMTVSRFIDGVVPSVDIGAGANTCVLTTLNVPAASGSGVSSDTSTLGLAVTAQVGGDFQGTIIVEVSEDAGATWGPAFSFNPGAPRIQSTILAAQRMRVTRVGVPIVNPGLPNVVIGATTSGSSGGGSSGGQAFVYTATGAETASFILTLPTAMSSTSYVATVADGGRADGNLVGPFTCPVSQYTLTTIQILCPEAPAAGDKLIVIITPTTS